MKFVEQEKTGTVLGNEVKAAPVPYSRLRKVDLAQKSEDYASVVAEMCGIIADFVTMSDGEKIDTDALSSSAIQELFKFATGLGASVADFT